MNLTNTYREKLLNAILFFARTVKLPSKVKMFKLLFFLDFEHFRQTGRSVTNLDYYAYDFGPVPESFFQEIRDTGIPPQDFADALALVGFKSDYNSKSGAMFGAKKKPDMSVFSPREKKILEALSTVYRDVDGQTISEISHLPNQPWDKTLRQKGRNAKIDYELALDSSAAITPDEAKEAIKEREEMVKNFPLLSKLDEG